MPLEEEEEEEAGELNRSLPPSPSHSLASSQHNNNNPISTQKELGNEAILVDGPALFALRIARRLGPHFLDVLENHVEVAVEGAHAR